MRGCCENCASGKRAALGRIPRPWGSIVLWLCADCVAKSHEEALALEIALKEKQAQERARETHLRAAVAVDAAWERFKT